MGILDEGDEQRRHFFFVSLERNRILRVMERGRERGREGGESGFHESRLAWVEQRETLKAPFCLLKHAPASRTKMMIMVMVVGVMMMKEDGTWLETSRHIACGPRDPALLSYPQPGVCVCVCVCVCVWDP